MKMYITQLRGVFENLSELNDEPIEETGRRLAQTIVSGGTIYVHGIGPFTSMVEEITNSANALPSTKLWERGKEAQKPPSNMDTLLLLISKDKQTEALQFLPDTDSQVIGILQGFEAIPDRLNNQLDVQLTLPDSGALIPFNDSQKIGDPIAFAQLFLYHLIYFSTMEILDEQGLLD